MFEVSRDIVDFNCICMSHRCILVLAPQNPMNPLIHSKKKNEKNSGIFFPHLKLALKLNCINVQNRTFVNAYVDFNMDSFFYSRSDFPFFGNDV